MFKLLAGGLCMGMRLFVKQPAVFWSDHSGKRACNSVARHVNRANVMRRAFQCVLVAAGVVTMGVLGSGNPSLAAVASPTVAAIEPARSEVVGVAHPVVVTFTKSIVDRAAAERSIRITSPSNMTGRFSWLNDNVVQWNPDRFWPAHSHITLLAGGAPREFGTGAATLGVGSISAHTFTVSIDGQVARQMPASMGKPSRPTPTGNFTVLDRDRTVVMDSRTIGIPLSSPEGYRIVASYAERITNSGVYVHSAPWSVDSQGVANVSHGCINLSPDNAAWYYNIVNVGDPVIVQA
jgi:lipoprotein-anchoring transpeptidase ErfK/SrfK